MRNLLILLIAAFVMQACSTPVRVKTASMALGGDYLVTYWEGQCGGIGGGCSRGDTRVKVCEINDDNTVTCTHAENAETALNP